ncbi:DDB1- and CUL4-associated factor 15-like [Rissa tridactyla]|uniref:DDB1- and CUL4-associated factor 15-like n=1 Tax=Rissa tridactyla TaxID=75485 RepID=UPI0023BA5FFA|nr:DDB1- and CUL4-associated factor 15-like [Rissa tridactyla]
MSSPTPAAVATMIYPPTSMTWTGVSSTSRASSSWCGRFLFQDEETYSNLYLTVCEWPSDSSKVVVFSFNTGSTNSLLVNVMMMSNKNHWDTYISAVATPPPPQLPGHSLHRPG